MLNLDRIASVNATHPKPGVSDKYQFVSTTECLKTFQDQGWLPVQVSEKRANKLENRGFQKHLIRFRKLDNSFSATGFDNFTNKQIGSLIPEIVVVNSHDTGASFHIMAGMFRMACANGLIVADNLFASHRIRHVGYAAEKVVCAIGAVEKSFSLVAETIRRYQTIMVTREEELRFATEACLLRWEVGKAPNLNALLVVNRQEDKEPTLWNLFNKVQENMLQGVSKRSVWRATGFQRQARAIRGTTNIDLTVKINQKLWTLTEEYAKNKTELIAV